MVLVSPRRKFLQIEHFREGIITGSPNSTCYWTDTHNSSARRQHTCACCHRALARDRAVPGRAAQRYVPKAAYPMGNEYLRCSTVLHACASRCCTGRRPPTDYRGGPISGSLLWCSCNREIRLRKNFKASIRPIVGNTAWRPAKALLDLTGNTKVQASGATSAIDCAGSFLLNWRMG